MRWNILGWLGDIGHPRPTISSIQQGKCIGIVLLETKYGLGTDVLSTANAHATRRSGIRIADVAKPDDVYANVKTLVERARSEARPAS